MKKIKFTILVLIVAASFISAQSKVGIGIGGVFASPSGDMGDMFKSGFGGLGSVTYDVSKSLQLSLTTGYMSFGFNNDFFNDQLKEAGINVTVDVDATLAIIPIMVGGKYFLSQENFKPYLAAAAGVHISEITAKSVTVGGVTMDAIQEASETKGAFEAGVGFLYKLSPKLNLDINGKINFNGTEFKKERTTTSGSVTTTETSESTAMFFSIYAGLQLEL